MSCYTRTVVRYLWLGGHINPAVTLSMAVVGRLRWIKVPVYWLAQYLGAFIGSVCIYLVYYGLLLVADMLLLVLLIDDLWTWTTYRTSSTYRHVRNNRLILHPNQSRKSKLGLLESRTKDDAELQNICDDLIRYVAYCQRHLASSWCLSLFWARALRVMMSFYVSLFFYVVILL